MSCRELLARGVVLSGWYTLDPWDHRTVAMLWEMDTNGVAGWQVPPEQRIEAAQAPAGAQLLPLRQPVAKKGSKTSCQTGFLTVEVCGALNWSIKCVKHKTQK